MCIVHVLIFFAIAGGSDFASNRVLARPAFHVAFFLWGGEYLLQPGIFVDSDHSLQGFRDLFDEFGEE